VGKSLPSSDEALQPREIKGVTGRLECARALALLCVLCTWLGTWLVSSSADADDFFAGKTIDLIVGVDVGGGFDTYARLIARHLPDHIPGSPAVVVRNMPGAGSAKAAAYLYNLAPKDGTAIAALFPGVIVDRLLQKNAAGQFDPTKFTYLSSADSDARLCITGPSSKVRTFQQAMTDKVVIGATQPGAPTHSYAYMHRNATGAKFDIVPGYKGTASLMLAVERGEIEGLCGIDWSSLKSEKPQWLRDKTVNLLVQDSPEPNEELTRFGVPGLDAFIADDKLRAAADLVVAQQIFSRPYLAPPGVPDAQAKLLRQGFSDAFRDPKLLAEAEAARLSIKPSSAQKLQETVVRLYDTPSDVVERARQLITSPEEEK
jgi:tripartite-type tricarboxylate transporter receptor subunit TctC